MGPFIGGGWVQTSSAVATTATLRAESPRRGGELTIEGGIVPYVEVLPAGKNQYSECESEKLERTKAWPRKTGLSGC